MAHHSRLAGFIIDCEGGSLGAAAGFWSQALGLPVLDPDEEAAVLSRLKELGYLE